MRAIETKYRGCRFRSRLEARWACFIDRVGLVWEYEKEGYKLPDGDCYLPDFWLPGQECWLEIKGAEPTAQERRRCEYLAETTGRPVYLLWGAVEAPDLEQSGSEAIAFLPEQGPGFIGVNIGEGYKWCECPYCGTIGITFEGRADQLDCWTLGCPRPKGTKELGQRMDDTPRLRLAYEAARSARFDSRAA